MKKERAKRNQTISLTPDQEKKYLERCISEETISNLMLNSQEENFESHDSNPPSFYSSSVHEKIIDKTIMGNCMTILPQMPKKIVDLLIVDPPYNMDKTFGNSKFHKKNSAEYCEFTHQWIKAVLPMLKDNASIYVCCDWETSIIIADVLKDYFIIQNRITWQREKGRGAKTNWKNSTEDIWFATLSKNYIFNVDSVKHRRKVLAPYKKDGEPKDWEETSQGKFRDTFPSNFWDDISIPYWSMPENTDHPTQKPEKLLAKLILASSNEGDIILDPFSGTGTTSVVAKKLCRHYIGIEKEPEYCALSEKRLELAETNKTIQGYSDKVFWERNTLVDQKKFIKP